MITAFTKATISAAGLVEALKPRQPGHQIEGRGPEGSRQIIISTRKQTRRSHHICHRLGISAAAAAAALAAVNMPR